MSLLRANPFLGPLEGVGPENVDSLGPLIAFQGPSLPIALKMDLPTSKSLRPAP
jgi:hypothetical protein